MSLEPRPDVERLWGVFLIPRDKAPDEGFMLAHTSEGRSGPKRKPRWRAWWLPLRGRSEVTGEENVVPLGSYYRADYDILKLLDTLAEDHT